MEPWLGKLLSLTALVGMMGLPSFILWFFDSPVMNRWLLQVDARRPLPRLFTTKDE